MMHRHIRLLALILGGLAMQGTAHAADSVTTRPSPEGGGPTPVYVAVGILDIDEINSAAQNFTANVFFSFRWSDPRLAHPGPGERRVDLESIWHPSFIIINQQRAWSSLPSLAQISPNGDILYAQRLWGMFSQPLAMREFPFDSQNFTIQLASTRHYPHEVSVLADPGAPSDLAPEFSLPDWQILGWELDFTPYQPFASQQTLASYAISLRAKRYPSHYILKVIVPLVLIVAMSWIVFWIDPSELGVQIGVATTSMLTLIAYRFMVGAEVPVVPYLTRMDLFILGSTILVYAGLMQAVCTSFLARQDKLDLARRVDRWSRLVFPLTFIAMSVWSLVL